MAIPELSLTGFTTGSNSGIGISTLKPFEVRKRPTPSGASIAQSLNKQYVAISDAVIAMSPPPPVNGLSMIGGFELQIEDRAGLGYDALNEATKTFMAKAARAFSAELDLGSASENAAKAIA